MKKKILICGASGFIGRNLFEWFDYSYSGYDVYGTYFKNKPSAPKLNLFQVDLRDRNKALEVTRNMDIVINCSAMTDGMGIYDPAIYIPPNLQINQNLAEAAFVNKVRHFIFLSCTVMYPSSKRPLKEHEHDPDKVHPRYQLPARMKMAAEDICRIYAALGATKYTVVRHTNIYGPYDKFDLKRGHVLPATIKKVMDARDRVTVWGQGTESRDFLHIQDLIRFIEAAIGKQKNNFEIFNVGCGWTYSINELVKKIILCSGKKLGVVPDLEKPTIETHMNIDVQKATDLFGWKAQIELEDGLHRTIEWYRQNHNLQ